MPRYVRASRIMILAFLLVGICGSSFAFEHAYVENFSTTEYRYDQYTTAVWDTVAGEVRLAPFAITSLDTAVAIGSARDVHVAGDRAYVAENSSGLQIWEVDFDSGALAHLGGWDSPGYAQGVWMCGRYAYVADYESGLHVVDVSDPASPVLAGSYDTDGTARDVCVAGGLAFVADGDNGLVVIDVGDPASPTPLGHRDTPGTAMAVRVAGGLAYVADYAGGLQIIDVTDPAKPDQAGAYASPTQARGICLRGSTLFLANGNYGMEIVDVGNPAAPVLHGSCTGLGTWYKVEVSGNHAYAATSQGLRWVDVSDPASPVLETTVPLAEPALSLAVFNSRAVVAESGHIESLHLADSTWLGTAGKAYYGSAWSLVVAGDFAIGASGSNLEVQGIADVHNPSLVSSVPASGVLRLGTDGTVVYGPTDTYLFSWDVADAAAPVALDTLTVTGLERYAAPAVDGGRVYLARTTPAEVVIVDATDPADLGVIGSYAPGFAPAALLADGDQLFVGAGNDLLILDVSDPAAPALIGSRTENDPIEGLARAGDYVYCLEGDRVRSIDVSDPATPAYSGGWTMLDHTFSSMALSGRDLYVIGDDLLVQLRLGPRTIFSGFSRFLDANSAIAVSGDHVLISEGQDLALCETLNRYYDIERNDAAGCGIPVADAGSVRRVRIVDSDQVGYLTWTIVVGTAINIEPGEWMPVSYFPDEIAWGMHIHPDPAAPRNQPGCSSFKIEWLYDYPVIESIADIPGDQGGRVSLRFAAAHGDETPDLLDEGQEPVTSYALFRRYDEALPAAGDEGPRASYPPGEWHYVMDMPAMTEDGYSLVVPTLADSNEAGVTHSVFFVRSLTATPGVFFDSPPDSGYSVDNLAPNVPEGLIVEYAGDGNDLAWLESEAEDFRYFKIYRGSTPDFTVDPDNPAHMTTAIAWTDPLGDFEVYYKVAAVDFAGNESPAASPTGLTGVGGPPVPFALLQNVPNPFNPRTVIAFSLSEAAAVTLRIFDLSGREVARLLDAAPHDPGSHEVSWEGRDAGGRRLAAGAYIYRLETAGRVETRRMMLVK